MIIINRPTYNYKIFLLLFLLGSLVNIGEAYSQSLNSYQDPLQCEYLAKDAEKRHGLPENILLVSAFKKLKDPKKIIIIKKIFFIFL